MNADFNNLFSSYSPAVQELALQARSLIFDVAPEVSEHVYPAMKVIRYGLDGNKMAGIVFFLSPFKDGVSIGFSRGAFLPDPKELLEGTGKSIRHVKLRKSSDVRAAALRALLKAELLETQSARQRSR